MFDSCPFMAYANNSKIDDEGFLIHSKPIVSVSHEN